MSAEVSVPENKKQKEVETALPLSRIRTIMKSSLDAGQISNEVLFVMSKSAEAFIKHFTKEAYQKVENGTTLKYDHLSQYVQDNDNLEFLLQIIPKKIKVKDFKRLLEQSGEGFTSSESDSSSEDEK